ncbi:MAG: TonB-dependent receptor, partial [Bacteroidota bacterium]
KPRYQFRQFQAPRTISPEHLIDGSAEITLDSEIFDFKDAPAGYFLLDLGWNFQWKNLGGRIAVNNLLNARYRDYLNDMRYFADALGRNLLFNLNYTIKPRNKE